MGVYVTSRSWVPAGLSYIWLPAVVWQDLAWLEEHKHKTHGVLCGRIGQEGTFCISASSSLNHITHAWKTAFIGHVLGIVPPCTALLVFLLRLMRQSCVFA